MIKIIFIHSWTSHLQCQIVFTYLTMYTWLDYDFYKFSQTMPLIVSSHAIITINGVFFENIFLCQQLPSFQNQRICVILENVLGYRVKYTEHRQIHQPVIFPAISHIGRYQIPRGTGNRKNKYHPCAGGFALMPYIPWNMHTILFCF